MVNNSESSIETNAVSRAGKDYSDVCVSTCEQNEDGYSF